MSDSTGRIRPVLFAAFLVAVMPALCPADGLIVIHNPPTPIVRGHFSFAPLEVTFHHVNVDVNDSVATTTVDQEFYNSNNQRLEGTYLFPLPEGAHIDKFQMDINGTMQEAELLDAGKARTLYEEIVRKSRDPALLEYAGRAAFKVRIFPIEPNSRKHVKITYTQLLKSDAGLTEYTYPLNTEKFSARPIRDVSIKVSLTCKSPLKSVYCPTYSVDIRRDGDRRAIVGWEAHQLRPDTDFKLFFSRNDKAAALDLMTYRAAGDDGYFMLLASPGMDSPRKGIVQKRDVCFVIDTSGSMAENGGKKMEQARQALSFCLQNLNDGDRFEVIRFSTEAEPLFDKLADANKDNVARAQTFVAGLKPIGGTAIGEALGKARSLRPGNDADRPYLIIFLTDGQPTIGETNEDALVSSIARPADGPTRIFSFGIGTDVNTHLLDRIADQTHAVSQYVLPDEDLEVKLSSFYTKIKEPVLSNVKLSFSGGDIKVSQLYPGVMPDLFKGEQLVAFGRYSGSGPAAVRISGTLNGEKHESIQDVNFAAADTANSFIPRLWATRRVGYLLDEIRLHGESRELRDEVTRLARDHGIVTPYTAYLILEDERRRNVPISMQTMREFDADGVVRERAADRYKSNVDESTEAKSRAGKKAVANAQDVEQLKSSFNLQQQTAGGGALAKGPAIAAEPAAAAPTGYRTAQNYNQQARVVRGRAFYQNGTIWTDATAQNQKSLKQQSIKFNSDEYFALLKTNPEATEWLSLGEEVDLVLGDTLYMIR